MGRNCVSERDGEFELIRQRVCEVKPCEVGGVGAVIVELEPVAGFAGHRVGNGVGIGGHPFVDDDGQRSAGVIVGATGGDVIELFAIENLRVGVGAEGSVGDQVCVIE